MTQDATQQKTCQSDVVDPARAAALAVTLGVNIELSDNAQLPPFFHQVYFWDPQAAVALGRDGHPKVGGLIPDMGLPRRMWAGGRLQFDHALRIGVPAAKRSVCEKHIRKEGRSGPLGLVTLRHEILQNGRLCVTEWQDLVYRQDADPSAPAPQSPMAPEGAATEREVDFTSTQLFRYSALTFNGHRIHYDLPYAQDVEGYDGLVVHGPLLAQLLMLMALEELGPLAQFSFKATSPLMHFEKAVLCRKGNAMWVRAPDGRQCMTAEVQPQSQ
ncbi:MAG: acyl dehydratase [Roseobacter sp.]